MRRWSNLGAVLLVLTAACSGDGAVTRASSTTSAAGSAASTSAPVSPPSPTADCPGIGTVRPGGEVTYVDGSLFSVAADGSGHRCLSPTTDAEPGQVVWGPAADRLVLGRFVDLGAGLQPLGDIGDGRIQWSRPTGTSLLSLEDDGALRKRPAAGGPQLALDALDTQEEALYHPAGRHIVVIGRRGDQYGVWIEPNTGGEPTLVADAQSATRVHDLAFTRSGALMFLADHGARHHVHRVDLDTGALTTVADHDQPLSDLAVSPFPEGGVAYRVGSCDRRFDTVVTRESRRLDLPPTLAGAEPIGWLPGGALVVATSGPGQDCGSRARIDLHAVTGGAAVLLAEGVGAAAVRAALPPPPDPPRLLPDSTAAV